MKKICLLEAGNYLLGLDDTLIMRRLSVDECAGENFEDSTPLIFPASFFGGCDLPPSWSELLVIQVKNSADPLFLLFDRNLGEINAPERCASLPMLYPELAGYCCPQIITHNNQPVLLCDPDGMTTVLAKQRNNYGVVSHKTFCEKVQMEAMSEDTHVSNSNTEVHTVLRTASVLDDETFQAIVFWTMGEYLERGSDADCAIRSDELPPEYLNVLHFQEGVNDGLLQNLIDKTITKCGKFHERDLRRMRQNRGAGKV